MKKLIILSILSIFMFSCTETDILDESGEIEFTAFNLPELPDGYFYEAWLLVDGSYVSVGRINNDSIQNNFARMSRIDASDLNLAQSMAMTIENNSGAPSNYVLLIGNFEGNTVQLKPNITAQNGVQTLAQQISGAFTVRNASVPSEDESMYGVNGIWFFKGEENKEPTLNLKYEGLDYQAWTVKTLNNTDWNLNMGVIRADTLADTWRNFIPSPYTPNIPAFPGEDFLQQPGEIIAFPEGFFPVDVRGSKVIITPIFQNYNNSEIPFPIHLLQAEVPENATKNPNVTYELEINTNYSAKATKL